MMGIETKKVLIVLDDYAFTQFKIAKSNDFLIVYNLVKDGRTVFLTKKSHFINADQTVKACKFVDFPYDIDERMEDSFKSDALNIMFGIEPGNFYKKSNLFAFKHTLPTNLKLNKDVTVWIRLDPTGMDMYHKFNHLSGQANEIHDHKTIAMLGDKGFPYIIQSGEYLGHKLTDYISKQRFSGLQSEIIDTVDIEKIASWPKLLKPLDMLGGIGIKKADNILEAKKAIESMKDECKQFGVDLQTIMVQEIATHAHLGDVRIFIKNGKILGAFNRFPAPESFVSNFAQGGRQESVMRGFSIDEFDKLEKEMLTLFNASSLEMQKVIALKKLILKIKEILVASAFLQKLAVVGFDALLTQKNGIFSYEITEANLTSPLGEGHIMIDNISADRDLNKRAMNMFGIKTKFLLMQDYIRDAEISYERRLEMREFVVRKI